MVFFLSPTHMAFRLRPVFCMGSGLHDVAYWPNNNIWQLFYYCHINTCLYSGCLTYRINKGGDA